MAVGKKKSRQGGMWVATSDLARSPGHPFYERLNRLLEKHGFDVFAEDQCRSFYAELSRGAEKLTVTLVWKDGNIVSVDRH